MLLFDANKLDISDEFRRSIEAIHGYEDKVRIVLNKADQVKWGLKYSFECTNQLRYESNTF